MFRRDLLSRFGTGQAFCGIHASEKTNLLKALDARLDENETALAGFKSGPVVYDPAEIVRAGVFVSIDADGGLRIQRGYVGASAVGQFLGSAPRLIPVVFAAAA